MADRPGTLQPPANATVPNPDPTSRTLEQSKDDVRALRELLEAKISAVGELVKANTERIDRIPARVDEKIVAAERVLFEKFESVKTQFGERDRAADKAEVSAKTLVAGSETKIYAVSDRLGLVENRMSAVEARGVGNQEQRGNQNMNTTLIVGIVGVVLVLASILIPLLMRTGGAGQ